MKTQKSPYQRKIYVAVYSSEEIKRSERIEEFSPRYDGESLESWVANLVSQLRMLGSNEVLLVGEIPPVAIEFWSNRSSSMAVIIGSRRSHYLASHSELEELEQILILSLLDPDEVHSNASDPLMAIVYRRLDSEFYIRIALLISEDAARQNSVISARLAREKEVERGRARGRLKWKK